MPTWRTWRPGAAHRVMRLPCTNRGTFQGPTRRGAKARHAVARRKVWYFCYFEHVAVRLGGRRIAELRGTPGRNRKISPISSQPSPQRSRIHGQFFISGFTHSTCRDRVAPLKIAEPYRWWREKEQQYNIRRANMKK